jgi:two-component system, NarL family, sensor histidine kinase DegS
VNFAFEQQTGYSPQEVIGQRAPYPWWGRKVSGKRVQKLSACLQEGIKKREIRFITKDGEPRWFEVTCVQLQSPDSGNFSLITAVDITESKEFRDSVQSYITHVTKLQEREHERIARELHEEILQSLAALNLSIESTVKAKKPEPEKLIPQLAELHRKISGAINEIRHLSHELKSGVLDYLGLVGALENLIDNTKTEKQVQVSFSTNGPKRALPYNVESTLYLITHEAVRNAVNHSAAHEIKANLQFYLRKVRLTISDNGQGFEVPEKLMSFANLGKIGLVNMENWTLLLNGKLQVKSKLKHGTSISVEVKV